MKRFLCALFCILPLFFLFLADKASWDFLYLLRVLVHRDASTDDYLWKASIPIAEAKNPIPWQKADDCPAAVKDLSDYLIQGGTLALVVIHRGKLLCEWYGNGGGRDKPAAAFSLTKTWMSLLLARAISEHRIQSLEQSITEFIPRLQQRDQRFAAITLGDLIDMRSGMAFNEKASFPWMDQDAPRVYYASDLAKNSIEFPRIEAAPGVFRYNDYAPNLLGLVLQPEAGPMQELWSAIGAEYPAIWSTDSKGFAYHESGLVLTALDQARLGLLMLQDGKIGNRAVAPRAFVDRSFDPKGHETVADFAGTQVGYRNGWWVLDDENLLAMGRHGQVMLVSRSRQTVIVRMGLGGYSETNIAIGLRLKGIADQLPLP